MKNLFNYATKELSQDAFLRWLFESYQDENIYPIVKKLLMLFCEIDIENIKSIKTEAQWCKIDVKINIELKNQNFIYLFIEDKAYSCEHKQLKVYDEKIKKYIVSKNIRKVFYKTSIIDKDESERINICNEGKEQKWEVYNIDKIYNIFIEFENSPNIILKSYVEYLKSIYTSTSWKDKPLSNNDKIDINKWESFFKRVGKDVLDKSKYETCGVWKAGQFPYMCLVLRNKEFDPYLEIRSRDCISYKNKKGQIISHPFVARILFYGIEDGNLTNSEIRAKQEVLKNVIREKGFNIRRLKIGNKGFYRQIGVYSRIDIDTDEKFINELQKCANWYDDIMKFWIGEQNE